VLPRAAGGAGARRRVGDVLLVRHGHAVMMTSRASIAASISVDQCFFVVSGMSAKRPDVGAWAMSRSRAPPVRVSGLSFRGNPLLRLKRRHENMAKSARRNQSEGTLDRLGGRVLEMIGKLTGRKSKTAKGKAARVRGSGRSTKGRAKRAAR
jgi:uncharacterized protein YjbJ (UPF0337 family)